MRGYWWRSTRVDGCSPAAIEVAARHGWSERRGWGKETRAREGEEERVSDAMSVSYWTVRGAAVSGSFTEEVWLGRRILSVTKNLARVF